MRHPPDMDDKYEAGEAGALQAEPWQMELLDLNPGYCCWGPHEDYMWDRGEGWTSRRIFKSWADFGPWKLDDLNECANFYFEVERESQKCESCRGRGYHPHALWVSESFYRHSSPFCQSNEREHQANAIMASFGSEMTKVAESSYPAGTIISRYGQAFRAFCEEMRDGGGYWGESLDDQDRAALRKEGRDAVTLGRLGHDSINQHIMVTARLSRYGIPKHCPGCDGSGYQYTTPKAHVNLVLWWLHPRKGCSRGIEVRITRADLPAVFEFLRQAGDRNQARFAKLRDVSGEFNQKDGG